MNKKELISNNKITVFKIVTLFIILVISGSSPFWHIYFERKANDGIFGYSSMRIFLYSFGSHFILFGFSVFVFWILQSIPNLNKNIKIIKIIANIGVGMYSSISIYYLIFVFIELNSPYPDYFYEIAFAFVSLISSVIIFKTFNLFEKTNDKRRKQEENNMKFREEATKTIEELKEKVSKTQEEEKNKERQRISEELHDGILGKLFGTRLGLEFLSLNKESDKEKYQSFLNELKEIEKEIREVSHKLNVNLNNTKVGFESVINQLLIEKSKLGEFKYNLEIDKKITWGKLDEIKKVELYRILQEVLQNIIKHAKATNINFIFSKQENSVNIQLKDNGIGFDLSKYSEGIGIKNIKSRVKRLNATLNIISKLNTGTTLEIKLPITDSNHVEVNL